jgi:hypothetical protein
VREAPGRRGGRGDCEPGREAQIGEPPLDIIDQTPLTPKQMRDAGDVEPQPIRPVHLDQRRPAACPTRQPLHQRRIALGIGRNGDQ